MSSEEPETPPPLEYATRRTSSPRPPSLLEVTGFHLIAGEGVTLLVLTIVILSRPFNEPSITLGCGGIFVILIQWGLLAMGATCRRVLTGRILEERSATISTIAGVLGGLLIFGLPQVVWYFTRSQAAYASVTLLSLFGFPIVAPTLIFSSFKDHDEWQSDLGTRTAIFIKPPTPTPPGFLSKNAGCLIVAIAIVLSYLALNLISLKYGGIP